MAGGAAAGLADARVEAEVADQLARRGEAADVADRGHEGRRRLHVDAGDGHQPQQLRPGERLLGDLAIERGDLGVEEVDLAQTAIEGQPLVDRQLQPGQPAAAALAERVGNRRPLAQVAGEHAMRLVLRPCAGTHQPLTPVGQPPQRPRPLVRRPHLVEQAPRPSSRASVRASSRSVFAFASLIDLSLRVLATMTRTPCACSNETILSAPVVASSATTSPATQALREQLQRLDPGRDPTRRPHLAVLGDRDLAEVAVHIQPKRAHSPSFRRRRERGGTHDSDGFVLSAHPGKSQGRPRTTSSSQLISQNGLPIRVSQRSPMSREHDAHGRAGRSFIPGQRVVYRAASASRRCSAPTPCATSASRRTRRAGTARSSASSRPSCASGRTYARGRTRASELERS